MVRVEDERDDLDVEADAKAYEARLVELDVKDKSDAVFVTEEILERLVLAHLADEPHLPSDEVLVDGDPVVPELIEELIGEVQRAQ